MTPNAKLKVLGRDPEPVDHRVNAIDLLRFIAAVAVVIFHLAFRGFAEGDRTDMSLPLVKEMAKYGYLGVELFFLISGFVILKTASSGDVRRFLISRATRLYPAFWVGCTLTSLVILSFGAPRYEVSLFQYLVNMTMMSDFVNVSSIDGVYWSLFVEIKFYVLVALILSFRQLGNIKYFLFLWIVVVLAMEIRPVSIIQSLLITEYAAYFIAGSTLYLAWLGGFTVTHVVLLLACWILALYKSLHSLAEFERIYQTDMSAFSVATIVSALFMILTIVASRRTGWVGRKSWILLGGITYPLYLIHQNIGYIAFNSLYPEYDSIVVFLGTIGALLLVSFLIYEYIEGPLAKALRRLLLRIFGGLTVPRS